MANHHPQAQIILTADIDPERAKAIQHHYPTMYLKPNATVRDIVWELNLKGAIIQ